MNQAKAVGGFLVLALCTFVSLKLVLWDGPELKETQLIKLTGELSSIGCYKDRRVDSIRVQSNSTRYWLQLQQQLMLLPTCEQAKNQWPIGSQIVLYHTPVDFKPELYAYNLSVNGKQIFGYSEAIESINESNHFIIGFTTFMWVLILSLGIFKRYKHNQALKQGRA